MTAVKEAVVRPAELSDAAAISRVQVETWKHAYRGLIPQHILDEMSVEQRSECWESNLKSSASSNYLLEHNNQVEGFVSVGASRDADSDARVTGEVWAIYVHPAFQKNGFGRILIERAELALLEQGFELYTLWVLEGNEAAKAFYRKLELVPDGAVKTESLKDVILNEIRFRKVLI